jgi:hypothetical protein
MSTAKKRKPITVQLTPGKDGDPKDNELIAAIEAIPTGRRNQVLKAALAIGLGAALRQPEGDARLARIDDIWAALQDMPGWFERKFAQLGSIGPVEQVDPVVLPAPRLSQDEVTQRAAKLARAKW